MVYMYIQMTKMKKIQAKIYKSDGCDDRNDNEEPDKIGQQHDADKVEEGVSKLLYV